MSATRLPSANAGDEARAVDFLSVHAVRRERRKLEEGRAGVDQQVDPLAGGELAALVLFGDLRLAAAKLGRDAEQIVGNRLA